jgi:methionine sulfoxide reductase heme-binding subunit
MPFLREKNGRASPEKIAAFIGACLPAVWLLYRTWIGDLGPRPFTAAIHFSGDWAVRLLLISLAVTPARRLFGWGKLINARRTLGVAAACYAALHFVLYVFDQQFDLAKVASEIVLRFYLTIGFVALLGLLALAATSFDAAIRRLGKRWTTLHMATYPIAVLAIFHFMLQKKLEIDEPVLMAGFLFWLLGYRLIHRYAGGLTAMRLVGLAVMSTVLAALLEATWFAVRTGVDAVRVLGNNFEFEYEIRLVWWVLVAGIVVTALHLAVTAINARGGKVKRVRAPRHLAGESAP